MSGYITKEKLFTAEWFKVYSYIIIGALMLAVGYVFFITPHKIVPGGIFGISIVLYHKFGIPIGVMSLAFNIPLTLLGTKILGPKFGVKTVTGFVLTAVFIDLLTYYNGTKPLVPNDILLSSIFGGLLIGAGVGLLFKARATAGGTSIIALILEKYTYMPLSQLTLIVDSIIVSLSLVAFQDWTIPLYSLLVIYILAKTIDVVLQGAAGQKAVIIFSDKYEEIGKVLINNIQRGATLFEATGMYSNNEKKVVFSVMGRREAEILKMHVRRIDPKAFVTVIEATEILGKGFKSLTPKAD